MIDFGINITNKNAKIAVAMSGGVDSSVVAAMLKTNGYNVVGLTMRLYNQADQVNANKSCCAGKDINDAKTVASQFSIPHYTLDLQGKFFYGVIDNFTDTYIDGKTPIPCIRCNQTVKFTDMLNEAKKMKADALVTGHYVRRVERSNQTRLYKAVDDLKDQSYFLFATTKSQLEFLRFPLGNYTKDYVRKLARDLNIKVKNKPDSQDICFITGNSYSDFISKIRPDAFAEGDILNSLYSIP